MASLMAQARPIPDVAPVISAIGLTGFPLVFMFSVLKKESAKILASILYWCEGSKYPSSNFVAFSNSDENLVVTFLNLFRLGFKPKESKLKASLQLHTTHNKEEMTSFWSKALKIPKSQFYKPTITKPTKNMKRRDYKGTCTIRYYDVYILLEIMGIFEEFSKKI